MELHHKNVIFFHNGYSTFISNDLEDKELILYSHCCLHCLKIHELTL